MVGEGLDFFRSFDLKYDFIYLLCAKGQQLLMDSTKILFTKNFTVFIYFSAGFSLNSDIKLLIKIKTNRIT